MSERNKIIHRHAENEATWLYNTNKAIEELQASFSDTQRTETTEQLEERVAYLSKLCDDLIYEVAKLREENQRLEDKQYGITRRNDY